MNFSTNYVTNTYGAYRKSKMVIDILNVILAIIIVALFVALVFLSDRRSMLFPLIFLTGGIDNALACAKCCMNGNKIGGIILGIVTILILLLAFTCFRLR